MTAEWELCEYHHNKLTYLTYSAILLQCYTRDSRKNVLSKYVKEHEKYQGTVNYSAVSGSRS